MTPTPATLLSVPTTLLTLHSRRTGREFIYRIQRAPLVFSKWYYVDLLTDLSNEADFARVGCIVDRAYIQTNSIDLPSTAFAFFWHRLREARPHPDLLVTIHDLASTLRQPA